LLSRLHLTCFRQASRGAPARRPSRTWEDCAQREVVKPSSPRPACGERSEHFSAPSEGKLRQGR
jgi:hypothetical protein